LSVQQTATEDHPRGIVIRSRRSDDPVELDGRGSIIRAVVQTGSPIPRREDLHEQLREPHSGTRFLFVVDSSGSHGVKDRMRLVKGAVTGLLKASCRPRDEVCVVAFRGTSADVVMEPTRDSEAATQALEYLPTGGRTPLASGLELAIQYVTPATVMVIITDGRANVPSKSSDAWADALAAAQSIRCPALVVDTENSIGATGRPVALSEAMKGRHVRLDALDAEQQLILAIESLC
jgi:magnesium chelatase subunit D